MAQYFRRRKAPGIAVAGVLASSLLMAGCGGDSSAGSSGKDGKLSFAVLAFVEPVFKDVVADYEKTHPGTKITIRQSPADPADYVQQLASQRLGGDAPDLFMNLDVISEQLASSGFSEDLTPWLKKDQSLTRESFAGSFLNSYIPLRDKAKVTGLPIAADATVVFYNKKIFKQAGVALPTDDWTYDEMVSKATAISQAGKGKYWGLAPMPDGSTPVSIWQAQYQPMIVANGGKVYDAASNTVKIGQPEAIKAWEMLLQPWRTGGTPKYADVTGASPPTFNGGSYGMMVGVRAHIPGIKHGLGSDWDVVQMPKAVGDKRPVGGGSYGLGMFAGSKKKDAAWQFIKWFYSNDGGIKLLQENYSVVPPTEEGIKGGVWRKLQAPPANVGAFDGAIHDAVIAPQLPGGAQATLDKAVLKAVQEVLLKNRPVADAFKEAEDTVNADLAKQ